MKTVRENESHKVFQVQRDLLGMALEDRYTFIATHPERLSPCTESVVDYAGAVTCLDYLLQAARHVESAPKKLRDAITEWKCRLAVYVAARQITDKTLRTLARYAACWLSFDIEAPVLAFAALREAGYLFRGEEGVIYVTGLAYRVQDVGGEYEAPCRLQAYRVTNRKVAELPRDFAASLPLLPNNFNVVSGCGGSRQVREIHLTAEEEGRFARWYRQEAKLAA